MIEPLWYVDVPRRQLEPVIAAAQELLGAGVTRAGQHLRLCRDGLDLRLSGWSLQQLVYLKAWLWQGSKAQAQALLAKLGAQLEQRFPYALAPLAPLDSGADVFEALSSAYPHTVAAFRQLPEGRGDLERLWWWEARWRGQAGRTAAPPAVVDRRSGPMPRPAEAERPWDVVVLGGALGMVQAAALARSGQRVAVVERLEAGKMHREWNISRTELKVLVETGLFSADEIETLILREYRDGFHKFFDGNNPADCCAPVLHTPTVLNIAIDSQALLLACQAKLKAAGGAVIDFSDFLHAAVHDDGVVLELQERRSGQRRQLHCKLVLDAMGTASSVAWQLHGGQPFDSVCPTVGMVLEGIPAEIWDPNLGDVLFGHGDISRQRQLIWELFPGKGEELTFYLFHYHRITEADPGSLLELYEDFFQILGEYKPIEGLTLRWKKPTFGYIPGYFHTRSGSRRVGFERILAIGDAASLQSPLIFTGFGTLVRNLPRLTSLIDQALRLEQLDGASLNQVRASQANVTVTWLFSRGMMVPPGRRIAPQAINAMLNVFFGVLATGDPAKADAFMKDRAGWLAFTSMALVAAWRTPKMLLWILDLAGPVDLARWLVSYLEFSLLSLRSLLLSGWLPQLELALRPRLEAQSPALALALNALAFDITDGIGRPRWQNQAPLTKQGR